MNVNFSRLKHVELASLFFGHFGRNFLSLVETKADERFGGENTWRRWTAFDRNDA